MTINAVRIHTKAQWWTATVKKHINTCHSKLPTVGNESWPMRCLSWDFEVALKIKILYKNGQKNDTRMINWVFVRYKRIRPIVRAFVTVSQKKSPYHINTIQKTFDWIVCFANDNLFWITITLYGWVTQFRFLSPFCGTYYSKVRIMKFVTSWISISKSCRWRG